MGCAAPPSQRSRMFVWGMGALKGPSHPPPPLPYALRLPRAQVRSCSSLSPSSSSFFSLHPLWSRAEPEARRSGLISFPPSGESETYISVLFFLLQGFGRAFLNFLGEFCSLQLMSRNDANQEGGELCLLKDFSKKFTN